MDASLAAMLAEHVPEAAAEAAAAAGIAAPAIGQDFPSAAASVAPRDDAANVANGAPAPMALDEGAPIGMMAGDGEFPEFREDGGIGGRGIMGWPENGKDWATLYEETDDPFTSAWWCWRLPVSYKYERQISGVDKFGRPRKTMWHRHPTIEWKMIRWLPKAIKDRVIKLQEDAEALQPGKAEEAAAKKAEAKELYERPFRGDDTSTGGRFYSGSSGVRRPVGGGAD